MRIETWNRMSSVKQSIIFLDFCPKRCYTYVLSHKGQWLVIGSYFTDGFLPWYSRYSQATQVLFHATVYSVSSSQGDPMDALEYKFWFVKKCLKICACIWFSWELFAISQAMQVLFGDGGVGLLYFIYYYQGGSTYGVWR